jgi:hypothetical protein
MSKYQELRELAAFYGQSTILLIRESKRFGDAITSGLATYLGAPPFAVRGIPPAGLFETRVDYRDAAYSFHSANMNFLEPIKMGLSVEIKNLKDDGAAWIRTTLEFWVNGGHMEITVGENGKVFTLPRSGDLDFAPVYEAIFDVIRAELSTELEEAMGRRQIGFVAAVT